MKKTYILGSIAAAVALSTSSFAKHDDHCVVLNAEKVNVIAAGKAHGIKEEKDTAGKNIAKHEGAWIKLDKKKCEELNEAIAKGMGEDPAVKAHADVLDSSLIVKNNS